MTGLWIYLLVYAGGIATGVGLMLLLWYWAMSR